MATIGLAILVFAVIGGWFDIVYYIPNIRGDFKVSTTTRFEVKVWSGFFGIVFGTIFGVGVAYGLGRHFYPTPYELTLISFQKVDGGQAYLVMEETPDYNVISETVPASAAEITPVPVTLSPAVIIYGRFENPRMKLWALLPDQPHYHFFLPTDPPVTPEKTPLEPLAISSSRGALTFIKRAILSL